MNDDIISRQDVINTIDNEFNVAGYIDESFESVKKVIKNIPSAQKTGRWINGYCSECGEHAPYWSMATTDYKSDYCPKCGAYMKGEENDNI